MLSNLQILRAFAALNVVLFHIIEIGGEQGFAIPALEFLRGWGANGIDIFFVLSGFIMVYIAELRPRKPVAFLHSRAVRIVPIYWILTGVGFVAILLTGDFRGEPLAVEAVLASFLFLTRWTTLDMPILYVGWTLEWEMMFYLIFGLCLLFKNKTVQFILPLIILSGLVVFAGQDSIILEFGFGMIIAKLSKLTWAKSYAGLLTLAGTALLLASIWIKPDLPQPVLWGLPSALLVLGLVNISQWKFRLGEHLGDASYSIYLIQVFTIPVFYKIAEKTVPELSPLFLAIACLAGTALAGSLFHLVVEKQVQKLLGRKKKTVKPAYDVARLKSATSASR
ncbi:acyltransferase family protein [Litorimonas sp. WD9-15]|uniref:acyltransferase family protein n=1 Tax=Litorimonas sp. WD9-15 TaxID=3418716 RepID=UPI003D0277F1